MRAMTLQTPPADHLAGPTDTAQANARALDALANQARITVPSLLRALVASGATFYGPEWRRQWRSLCLTQPPAFISCEDFEWMDADERDEAVAQWLHPAAQGGQRFLPFAQNGAGDAYCLTLDGDAPADAPAAVSLVPHDGDEATVLHASFNALAAALLLQALADLSHQLDDYTEEEAVHIARLDVARVTAWMPPGDNVQALRALAAQAPQRHTVQNAPRARPREVLALVSPSQHDEALARWQPPSAEPLERFGVIPRWEVRAADTMPTTGRESASQASPFTPVPASAPTWQALAADPATRRQALRAYQAAYQVDLLAAKAAVDAYCASL